MEHRYGSRFPINLTVEVLQGDKKCGLYRTRNIGFGGLFIAGCSEKIHDRSIVTTRIHAMGKFKQDMESTFSIDAFAVHKADNGVGLMWADKNDSAYKSLSELFENLRKAAS